MNVTMDLLGLESVTPTPCIGVFDSGVGGLSILRALHARVPHAPMIYIGDAAHAPYGDRSAEHVVERSTAIVECLAALGATMIVVACNTATVVAIEGLRARWPKLVFVGVEPGVKPAVSRSRTRRIAVMATAATANSDRLRYLIARYAADAHVHVQPCPGLVDAIERGVIEGQTLFDLLKPHCAAIRAANVDTVVLGCTHYPFVEAPIRALLGAEIIVIDTATAVAERCAALWEQSPPVCAPPPTIRVISTGATGTLQLLLALCPGLAHLTVEVLTIIATTSPG